MDVIPSDTYLSFFLSRPLVDVWHLFLLTLGRIIPIISIAPFLGGKMVSNPVKMGFGVALAPIFLPYLIVHSTVSLTLDLTFMLLLIKEVLVGVLLGLLIAVPFYYAQAAGTLIDHQRGAQSLQVNDPSTQTQASPTGLLYNNMMLVIFFSVGGPLLFFSGVFESYRVLPADQFISAEFFSASAPVWHTLIKLCNTIVLVSLQLCAPSLIAILMSDLFLGIANRMAPQVQISFLLWSLKAFIGIAVLWAGWWFILKQMDAQSLSWTKSVNELISTFGGK